MNISVLTPDRTVFEGPIKSLTVPGVGGRFEILRKHAALVSALKSGKVLITEENGTHGKTRRIAPRHRQSYG